MNEILNAFGQYLRGEKDASSATVRAYLNDLKKFFRWYHETTGEAPKLDAVGQLDVAEFKRYMLNRNQKPTTINRALVSLSVFFDWAVRQGHAAQNPVSGVKPVRETRSAPRALGRRELWALMRAVQKSGRERDIAIVTVLIHTGLRVSELCALTIEDVTLRERSGTLVVRSGKGNKRREIPLNATARKALKEWLDVRGDAPGPLFTSQKGGALSPRAVEHLLARYAYAARLEGVTPHVLRHTFCKSLIDAGESLDRVAVLAGHSNLNTTARYTRPSNDDLQRAVDRLAWE